MLLRPSGTEPLIRVMVEAESEDKCREYAEKLIEAFMLSANETVAYHMSISNLPNCYRVHEEPNIDSVTNVYRMINEIGFKAILPKNKKKVNRINAVFYKI